MIDKTVDLTFKTHKNDIKTTLKISLKSKPSCDILLPFRLFLRKQKYLEFSTDKNNQKELLMELENFAISLFSLSLPVQTYRHIYLRLLFTF